MNITKSEMKIAEDGFNNCPERNELIKMIKQHGLDNRIEFIDVEGEKPYWKNDEATLVFRIKGAQRFEVGLLIGQLATETQTDEFNYFRPTADEIVIRFWWD